MLHVRQRDQHNHEDRDPDATIQSPLRRIRIWASEIVVQGGNHIGHKTLHDNQVTRRDLSQLESGKRAIELYLMETPKHLMAIAASKKTAALGKVSWETAWKEDRLWPV